MARAILANWVHPRRRVEATKENVHRIKQLMDNVTLEVLLELASPPRLIWGQPGRQLDLELTLGTLDNRRNFCINTLLDSGCTNSCIDKNFIKNNRINVIKLPIPVLVYNTDGTPNAAGAVTEIVRLHTKIRSHIEIVELSIVELGKTKVFIGHDWLKKTQPWDRLDQVRS